MSSDYAKLGERTPLPPRRYRRLTRTHWGVAGAALLLIVYVAGLITMVAVGNGNGKTDGLEWLALALMLVPIGVAFAAGALVCGLWLLAWLLSRD